MQNNIASQIKQVLQKYPSLSFDVKTNCFSGKLIVDPDDDDAYFVKIDVSPFPQRFPIVWEIGERIPRTQDRHIYTSNGSCCFTTTAWQQVLLRKRIKNLSDFIDKIALKYFQNNSYYELNHQYKNGEYNHGVLGILQGYKDILEVENYEQVTKALILRLKRKKFGRNELCFCGSKKIKFCHFEKYKLLYCVDDQMIENDLNSIWNLLLATY